MNHSKESELAVQTYGSFIVLGTLTLLGNTGASVRRVQYFFHPNFQDNMTDIFHLESTMYLLQIPLLCSLLPGESFLHRVQYHF